MGVGGSSFEICWGIFPDVNIFVWVCNGTGRRNGAGTSPGRNLNMKWKALYLYSVSLSLHVTLLIRIVQLWILKEQPPGLDSGMSGILKKKCPQLKISLLVEKSYYLNIDNIKLCTSAQMNLWIVWYEIYFTLRTIKQSHQYLLLPGGTAGMGSLLIVEFRSTSKVFGHEAALEANFTKGHAVPLCKLIWVSLRVLSA